ncbi:MAG TPA: amylo-alpha-1,6-glucosidase [Bryobacteraceae bacterium]|nr:amylo-alpha-1,6-glucosidase [Bryobacteraceae bacterium]
MHEAVHIGSRPVITGLDTDPHLTQEWLVTNGLGGYASGTVAGPITRRYHGLLIAALPNPLGRFMMLHALFESIPVPEEHVVLAGPKDLSGEDAAARLVPTEFRLEAGLPVWTYQVAGRTLEKRVMLSHKQNTVYVSYRLIGGEGTIQLQLRPGINLRPHDDSVDTVLAQKYVLTATDDGFEISGGPNLPALRMAAVPELDFTFERKTIANLVYLMEKQRGYPYQGSLWSPGYFCANLAAGSQVTLIASTESWDTIRAMKPDQAYAAERNRRMALLQLADPVVNSGIGRELLLAADQFLISPVGRPDDVARAHAAGQESQSVIAGYHWFTDWGRDTMISLEGLTLTTRRFQEARWILHTFAHHVKDGLIPNMFPEGERQGVYHTADASLWFFHAIDRYLEVSADSLALDSILPKLLEIVNAHIKGTLFGIHVDPADRLLSQGQEGYQLTWMDAKVDGWVVTPRRGKAVEINALWYNALCLLAGWMNQSHGQGAGDTYAQEADRVRESFNRRFWNEKTGCLFDVVDGENGDDPKIRPNQVFAISLPRAVLDRQRWAPVLEVVTRDLLTPLGLRTLSPHDPDYKPTYSGDLRARDAAYHQGSVWAWLMGAYVDAWLKLHPEKPHPDLLQAFSAHLDQSCIGSISEIFDAESPHTPRGCIAQAWSVAEVLRCLAKLNS